MIKEIRYDEYDLDYEAELTADVYLCYLFRKKFGRDFQPMQYFIDTEWKEFYDQFCEDWMNNKIDERAIQAEPTFDMFLRDYFENEACIEYFKQMEEEADLSDFKFESEE